MTMLRYKVFIQSALGALLHSFFGKSAALPCLVAGLSFFTPALCQTTIHVPNPKLPFGTTTPMTPGEVDELLDLLIKYFPDCGEVIDYYYGVVPGHSGRGFELVWVTGTTGGGLTDSTTIGISRGQSELEMALALKHEYVHWGRAKQPPHGHPPAADYYNDRNEPDPLIGGNPDAGEASYQHALMSICDLDWLRRQFGMLQAHPTPQLLECFPLVEYLRWKRRWVDQDWKPGVLMFLAAALQDAASQGHAPAQANPPNINPKSVHELAQEQGKDVHPPSVDQYDNEIIN